MILTRRIEIPLYGLSGDACSLTAILDRVEMFFHLLCGAGIVFGILDFCTLERLLIPVLFLFLAR